MVIACWSLIPYSFQNLQRLNKVDKIRRYRSLIPDEKREELRDPGDAK